MTSRYSFFDYFLGFAIVAVFLIALYFTIPARWIDPWKIAHRFGISASQVRWKDKPDACDYFRSPMGNKGCRFKMALAAYNSDSELVAGDNAPLFRDDPATRKTLVSYDRGNSWHARGRDTSTAVALVIVNWVKVGE
jgi:hypothetical protein